MRTQISATQHSRDTQVSEPHLWEAKAQDIWQAQNHSKAIISRDRTSSPISRGQPSQQHPQTCASCLESGRNSSIPPRALGTCKTVAQHRKDSA